MVGYTAEDEDFAEMLHFAERCAYHLWQAGNVGKAIYHRDYAKWIEILDSYNPDEDADLQPAYAALGKHLPQNLLNFIDGD